MLLSKQTLISCSIGFIGDFAGVTSSTEYGAGPTSLPPAEQVIHSFELAPANQPLSKLLLTLGCSCDYPTPLFFRSESLTHSTDIKPVVSYEENLSTQ
jgi:hypothetical protein